MQMNKMLFCHWDFVRLLTEKDLLKKDGTALTLSVTDGKNLEFMIFLEKADNEYEVRVYKGTPNDKYVPYKFDNVKHYEENDEYATFSFEKFYDALHFVEILGYVHPEYKARPMRKISERAGEETNNKRIKIIKRSNALQKIIKEKQKELQEIQEECKHAIIADFLNENKRTHIKKCLLCGKVMDMEDLSKYKFIFNLHTLNTIPVHILSEEQKYILTQHIYSQIAKENPQIAVKELYDKIIEKFHNIDGDTYTFIRTTFWKK